MTVIDDIAEASGVSPSAVARDLNRAALADGVLGIILARHTTNVSPERVAEAAGVTTAELSSAVLRYHDRHRREQHATRQAYRSGPPRRRHVPIGEPPSDHHLWCKRGSHWVHRDDMAKASRRLSGYGDWCKACYREYWATKVAAKRARVAKIAQDPTVPGRKRAAAAASRTGAGRTRATRHVPGPTCTECGTLMVGSIDGPVRCRNPECSIGRRYIARAS